MGRRRRQAERYSVVKLNSKGVYAIRWTRDGGRTWRQESLGVPATDRNRSKAAAAAANRARELFVASGDDIAWEVFCDRYETEWLTGLAPGTAEAWKTCRNSVEQAIGPRWLADVDSAALHKMAAWMRRRGLAESTIKSRMAGISAALGWAKEVGFLDETPKIPRPPRARGVRRRARSRPVTGEEFERMLENVRAGLLAMEARKPPRPPSTRKFSDDARVKSVAAREAWLDEAEENWKRFLEALWLSGLRLDEAVRLSWDWGADFAVDLSARFPAYRIKQRGQKGARDQLCPMAPEFAEFLVRIPEANRRGRVLGVTCTAEHAGRIISAIGQMAGVVVNTERKTATAQDLRRSFGTRWAVRVQPAVLRELMRHRDIKTTMEYYVDINADTIGEELWRFVRSQMGDQKGDPKSKASAP